MEKKEAVREYCIDVALKLLELDKNKLSPTVEDVIKSAQKLEEYILHTFNVSIGG